MKKVIKLSLILVFFILLIGGFNKVFGAEDIQIKITPNNKNLTTSDVMLIIDISSTKIFDSSSFQAVQILIGEESTTNKWVDLGNGNNGIPLKKSYNYIIKSNSKVTIRAVTWSKEDKSDIQELAKEIYEVSNIDKTNPVIEKIDITSTTNNSISLNIVAKDLDSGVAKYTCVCEDISYNKTSDSSKFDISGLEENKEYNFVITVEDKIGNKTSTTQKIKTKINENNTTNNVENSVQNSVVDMNTTPSNEPILNNENIEDNTIANTIIPEVGKKHFILGIFIILIIVYIIINRQKIE